MAPDRNATHLYAGVDIGGTKVLALVTTSDGKQLGAAVIPTPSRSPDARVVATLAEATRRAAREAGASVANLRAVGVASAGAVDVRNGTVVHSPHLPSFKRTPVVSMLRDLLGKPVVIGNDANMAALAEHRFGAGRGFDNFVYITISTGIGSGIIVDNKLYLGAGGYAGEVGHMTVDAHGPYGKSTTPGAWESLCSGTALVRIVTERIQAGSFSSLAPFISTGKEMTAVDVFSAFRAGDPLARAVVAEAIEYMGAALTGVVNILDPGLIIIGGGLSNEWDDYIAPAVAIMRKQSFAGIGVDIPVVPPTLGADSGALGAAVLAMEAG